MKKRVTLLLMLLSIIQFGYSQSVNLNDGLISPAPLPSVEANGTGVAEFKLKSRLNSTDRNLSIEVKFLLIN